MRRPAEFDTDLVLVVAGVNRGWVLDGICRETAARLSVDHRICYVPGTLPRARAYFFSHWSLAVDARINYSIPAPSRIIAFYTHPREIGYDRDQLVRKLNECDAILSMCSHHAADLIRSGVHMQRISTVLGAADAELFRPGTRRGELIGFVSAYYERKDPTKILAIVKSLPHRNFLLVGKDWERSPIWDALRSLDNLEIVSPDYSAYPDLYRRMAVFVSPSTMEGGPIPLIEAMLSEVTPVVTRTGFAPDIVVDRRTGYLCDIDSEVAAVVDLIERAVEVPGVGIRKSVAHLNWDRYARILTKAAFPDTQR